MDRPGDRGAAKDARQFVEKWSRAELTERAASHEHFVNLSRLLGQPTVGSANANGKDYASKHPSSLTNRDGERAVTRNLVIWHASVSPDAGERIEALVGDGARA